MSCSSWLLLQVHVLNPSYQVHLILDNKVQDVLLDMPNITQTLTSLSGFEVLSHSVTLHEDDSLLIQPELEKTDLFVYATDSNHLVNTDRIIRYVKIALGCENFFNQLSAPILTFDVKNHATIPTKKNYLFFF